MGILAENLKESEWRDIRGYEGYYQISNFGQVRGLTRLVVKSDGIVYNKKGGLLKPTLSCAGYYVVELRKSCRGKKFLVHRLVAFAFIPNPENKPEVNHKNFIKTDNRVENLEWLSGPENAQHFHKAHPMWNIELLGGYGATHPRSKAVNQHTKAGEFIKRYESINIAGKETGVSCTSIRYAAQGIRQFGKGFKWSYDK